MGAAAPTPRLLWKKGIQHILNPTRECPTLGDDRIGPGCAAQIAQHLESYRKVSELKSEAQDSSPQRSSLRTDAAFSASRRLKIRTPLPALRSAPTRALEVAPHPLGTKEGGWKRGGMRRSCQNSLLTAKVTTLFPGP